MSLRIEPLNAGHRALLRDFQNQHARLEQYLARFALRHVDQDLLARTYLALSAEPKGDRVAGYFSLATVSVERELAAQDPELDRLPRFPIPGVLLARLAVDNRVQGQGVGRFLFDHATSLVLRLCDEGPVSFRLFVTDAIDAEAARFYAHFGFKALSEGYPRRMVLDLKPLLGR